MLHFEKTKTLGGLLGTFQAHSSILYRNQVTVTSSCYEKVLYQRFI